MDNQQQQYLEAQIRATIGTASAPNFHDWKTSNQDSLIGVRTVDSSPTTQPRSRAQVWRVSFAAAAVVLILIAASWVLMPRSPAFADTIEAINDAKTISWVRTSYQRVTSKDGKRFWLKKQKQKVNYMAPGYFRYDDYDSDGKLIQSHIIDPVKKQRLTLSHRRKIFDLADIDSRERKKQEPNNPSGLKLAKLNVGPFGLFNRAITEGGKIVGQRVVDGQTVDVLRWRNKAMGIHNPMNVGDVWIDTETKAVVGTCNPGASVFDPEKLDFRDNLPEVEFSRASILGAITKDIVLDARVDPAIFQFNIPDGFSKAPAPASKVTVTEPELIEWLEILAKINDGQFVDGLVVRNTKKIAESSFSENPSDVEKTRRKLLLGHMRNGNTMPLWDFIEGNAYKSDCKYLGKGVKLGSKNEPVLIYRLKLTGKYRVVYGDLRIEDVSDEQAKRLTSE